MSKGMVMAGNIGFLQSIRGSDKISPLSPLWPLWAWPGRTGNVTCVYDFCSPWEGVTKFLHFLHFDHFGPDPVEQVTWPVFMIFAVHGRVRQNFSTFSTLTSCKMWERTWKTARTINPLRADIWLPQPPTRRTWALYNAGHSTES